MQTEINRSKFYYSVAALIYAVMICSAALASAEDASMPPPSLEKIAENVWAHKSYMEIEPWGPVLSQGIVIKTGAGVFLVDTAWDNDDTEELLDLIKEQIGETPTAAIITHAHQDKMGGVGVLNQRGVQTIMHHWTEFDAPERGLEISSLPQSETFYKEEGNAAQPVQIGGLDELLFYYPGPGHARDNTVVYYQPAKLLFGGCLIRPGNARSMGNTADGNVNEWAATVRNVANAFPDAEIVIPSHGAAGGKELLDHTIALAEKAAAQ